MAAATDDWKDRADQIHDSSIVIDGQTVRGLDPPEIVGGVTARVITVSGTRPYHNRAIAMRELATQLEFIDFYSDRLILVRTVDDIKRAKSENKLGLIFSFQGIAPIETDLSLVRVYYELGLRIMQLTYMENSLAGSGVLEANDLGLTSFGRQLIRSMERAGVLLDLAHVGRSTSLDALAYAQRPVVFSHCNPAGLFETRRNITDEEIKGCASTGGVVGITPSRSFYVPKDAPQPTLDDMIEHISYVIDLVGVDHVGIAHDTGPDRSQFQIASHFGRNFRDQVELDASMTVKYSRADKDVIGFQAKADFPNLTRALAKHGFSDEDISKIIGGNWLRVYEGAWTPQPARMAKV